MVESGIYFFFFQAEDGIRDVAVTGVQTCALPIWEGPQGPQDHGNGKQHARTVRGRHGSLIGHHRQVAVKSRIAGLATFGPTGISNPVPMERTCPGGATLRRDPDKATGGRAEDAEAADAALAASGDGSAFERLYRSHAARVHSLVRRMMGPETADDVTQDIFIRAC